MKLGLHRRGEVDVVRVEEAKLTYPVLSIFFSEVRRLVERGARKLVIDLAAVSYVDSAAIGCLVDLHRLVSDHGGSVKLSGPRPGVQTMLSLVLVHRFLEVCRDEAEALAAYGEDPSLDPKPAS